MGKSIQRGLGFGKYSHCWDEKEREKARENVRGGREPAEHRLLQEKEGTSAEGRERRAKAKSAETRVGFEKRRTSSRAASHSGEKVWHERPGRGSGGECKVKKGGAGAPSSCAGRYVGRTGGRAKPENRKPGDAKAWRCQGEHRGEESRHGTGCRRCCRISGDGGVDSGEQCLPPRQEGDEKRGT